MDKRTQLISIAIEEKGHWSRIAKAIKEDRHYDHPVQPCVTIYDKEYPECLRQLRFPPWVIFYKGDLSCLNQPKITIVGSRNMTDYGKWTTLECAQQLLHQYVLVSGLARGVDGIVHHTALINGAKTIGVIGSGLDTCYPRENKLLYQMMERDGLILSEYPMGVPVAREHFPWRNRILAALGEAIIVTQATVKSGTMITVNEGINLDKEIWCIPWPYGTKEGEGNNLLIFQGANILYEPTQLRDFHRNRKTLAL